MRNKFKLYVYRLFIRKQSTCYFALNICTNIEKSRVSYKLPCGYFIASVITMKSLILLLSAVCFVSGAYESKIDQKFMNSSRTSTLFDPTLEQIFQFPNFNTFSTLLKQLFPINNPVSAFRQANLSSNSSFPQSFIEVLQNSFETFQNTVNETLSKGVESVQNSIERLNSTAQLTFNRIQNLTAQSIANLDEKINMYNGTIRKCIEDNVSGYNQIISTAANQTIHCVSYKVQKGVEIIEQGRNDIANAVEGATNLSSALQKCSTNYTFGCYISTIVNIRNDTVLLPLQLSKRFADIEAYIGKTTADVVDCGIIIVQIIAAQSINVTQTITQCVFKND